MNNKANINNAVTFRSIKLKDKTGGTSFIDFHKATTDTDYDNRIVLYNDAPDNRLLFTGPILVNSYIMEYGALLSDRYVSKTQLEGLKIRHSWSEINFSNGVGIRAADDLSRQYVSDEVTIIAQFEYTSESRNYYITQTSWNPSNKTVDIKANSTSLNGEYQVNCIFIGV